MAGIVGIIRSIIDGVDAANHQGQWPRSTLLPVTLSTDEPLAAPVRSTPVLRRMLTDNY